MERLYQYMQLEWLFLLLYALDLDFIKKESLS